MLITKYIKFMKPDWKHLGVGLKLKKKINEKAMSMRLIHNDILWCAWRLLQCSFKSGRFVNYIFCL